MKKTWSDQTRLAGLTAGTALQGKTAAGFGIADEELRAANLCGIALPEGLEPEAVRQALAARQIHVSVRGAAVRVSPHRHDNEVDLLRFAEALSGRFRQPPYGQLASSLFRGVRLSASLGAEGDCRASGSRFF